MKDSYINKKAELHLVPLEKGLGYTIVKILKITHSDGSFELIVRPYEILKKEWDYSSENYEFLNENDYLIYDFILMGTPKKKGENKWIKLSDLILTDEELKIPYFKRASKVWTEEKWENLIWYLLKDYEVNNYISVNYENCKHLGLFQISTDDYITRKLTLFWIKKLKLDYNDYYSQDEQEKDTGIKAMLIEIQNSIFYSHIPKEIRGKPLGRIE